VCLSVKPLLSMPSPFSGWKVMPVGVGSVDRLVRQHYLHKWPGVVVCVLALVDKWMVIGCSVFALPPPETGIRYGVKTAWELARLFIEDGTPTNSETWFVARSIRWIHKYRPEVELLVSYADPSAGHTGLIYRAGNWIPDGMTDGERKTPRFDYVDPGTGKVFGRASHVPEGKTVDRRPRVSKFRYVYWLDGSHEKRRQEKKVSPAGDPCA
jgi:hypothetical protein